jgi:hypothetical protein
MQCSWQLYLNKKEIKMEKQIQKKTEQKNLSKVEQIRITVENIVPFIDKDNDFVIFPDKKTGKKNIEPRRDLALKIMTHYDLSYDTSIEKLDNKMAVVKAVVWNSMDRKASSFGLCTIDEIPEKSGNRKYHDCLTKAETRAIKRAIESLAGCSVINQLILKMFGDFEVKEQEKNVTNNVTTVTKQRRQELIDKIALIMKMDCFNEVERTVVRNNIKNAQSITDLQNILDICKTDLDNKEAIY